jgi:hypothetical protein
MEETMQIMKRFFDLARYAGPNLLQLIRMLSSSAAPQPPASDPAMDDLAEAARPSQGGDFKVAVILSRNSRVLWQARTVCSNDYDRAGRDWLEEEANSAASEAVLSWLRAGR